MDIKITIENKHCTIQGDPVIVCGNSTYKITFTFDEEWAQAEKKTARFTYIRNGARQKHEVDFTGSVVAVPPVYKTAELQVGVYAGDISSTTPARIRCVKSILCDTCTPDEYEAGKQSEYDRFWDTYQTNGTRTGYSYAFAGYGWNANTFKPKYDIKPTNANNMLSETGIRDLCKLLNDAGVTLDLSRLTSLSSYFAAYGYLETLPVLDVRNVANLSYFLSYLSALHTVEKIILAEGGTQSFSTYTFHRCNAIKEIRFEGVIGKSLPIADLQALSAESIQSIIDHLKDLTGTAAQTLTLHATVGAKLTAEQKAAAAAKNWTLVY